MATTGIAPNPKARIPRSVITDPSASPLRCTHRTDVVDGRKDQYDPERSDHDLGDQGKHRPRQFGRRAPDRPDPPPPPRRTDVSSLTPNPNTGFRRAGRS